MHFSLKLITVVPGLEKHVWYSTATYDMSHDDAIDQLKTAVEIYMDGQITWNDAQLLLFILWWWYYDDDDDDDDDTMMMMYTCK